MINLCLYESKLQFQSIYFKFIDCEFGKTIMAATNTGICHLAFVDDELIAINELKKEFPHIELKEDNQVLFDEAALLISNKPNSNKTIQLHIKGSDFQLKVWKLLLEIPYGQTTTYHQLAKQLKMPNGARAVGTAVGKNPIAYLIPCHRVIGSKGELSGYRWGIKRKALILEHEADKSLRLF